MTFTTTRAEPGSVARWAGKGIWTLLDQGLFASSNFVVSILLARWLAPEAYGVFTIAFALYLLVGALHSGFLSEPMLVFGASRFRGRVSSYLRALLGGHARFALAAATLLVLGGGLAAAAGNSGLGFDLVILGLAQPLLLAGWLMRRACYVDLKPRLAAAGSGVYALVTVGGLIALQAAGQMSVSGAFVVMSAASMIIAVLIAARLGVRATRVKTSLRKEVLERHWEYGRWAAATGALGWISVWASFLIVPMFGGLEAAASLRALMNFALPAGHFHAALTVLLLPAFVRALHDGRLKRTGALATLLVVGAMLGYGILIAAFGEPLMAWLYGGLYIEYAGLLWIVGLIPVLGALSSMSAAVLQAMERPKLVFSAHVAGAVTAVTLGVALIYSFGIIGALLFFVVGDAVNAAIKHQMVRRCQWGRAEATSAAPRIQPVMGAA